MVASDYAIKLINLAYPDDLAAVQKERQWQLAWWQDKTNYDIELWEIIRYQELWSQTL